MEYKIILYGDKDANFSNSKSEADLGHVVEIDYLKNNGSGQIKHIEGERISPEHLDVQGLNRFQLRVYPEDLVAKLDVVPREVVCGSCSCQREGLDYKVLSLRELNLYASDEGQESFYKKAFHNLDGIKK